MHSPLRRAWGRLTSDDPSSVRCRAVVPTMSRSTTRPSALKGSGSEMSGYAMHPGRFWMTTGMSVVLTLAFAISGAVLAPRAAEAATPRFDASGSVHCSVIGKGRFTPGIANASRSVVWRFVGKLGCYGTTGSGSVAVHGAKLRAVSGSSSRTCAAKPIPAVSVDIKWFTSGGAINPTHIVWASGAMSTANSRITTNFPGSGGTLVSGSYAGASTLGHIASDVVSFAPCSTAQGLKRYL